MCGCHHGHYEGLVWYRCRLVGSFLAKKFFTTTFARLTKSQAISQSVAFSSLSDQWEKRTSFTFLHISKHFFLQNYRVIYHGDQKISWWRICRWRVATSKSTCVVPAWSLTAFGDRPASSKSKFSTSVNSDLGNGSFSAGRNLWRWHVHLLVARCRWKYVSLILPTELWPQKCLLFGGMLAMVASENSFDAYICLY